MKLATCNNGHDVRLTTRVIQGHARCQACINDKISATETGHVRSQVSIDRKRATMLRKHASLSIPFGVRQ